MSQYKVFLYLSHILLVGSQNLVTLILPKRLFVNAEIPKVSKLKRRMHRLV